MEGRKIVVDLRSDTITLPTQEMRDAMANAEVGDDVFGEDPTVNRLQQTAAAMFGKEAALFVPSGTMGNLISAMSHCFQRGSEVIVGDVSHMNVWEQGGLSQIGGISTRVLPLRSDGKYDIDQMIRQHRTGENYHNAKPELVCVENPTDGKVLPLSYMKEVHDAARELGLKIHLDGARIGNAIVALRCKPTDITKWVDSANICLSKGLGAPVGSVIVGDKEFIARALRVRKVLGGGMRQCGILASAGEIALTKMMDRLEEDHANAKEFAQEIQKYSDILEVNIDLVQTNIVWFRIKHGLQCNEKTFAKMMEDTVDHEVSVKILPLIKDRVRATFHNGVTNKDTKHAIKKLEHVCNKIRKNRAV